MATAAANDGETRSLLERPSSMSAEEVIKATYGTGSYQRRSVFLIGAINVFGFPAIQLQTMVIPKLIADPAYANFTKDEVEDAQTMLFVGWAIGLLVSSPLCDRFGRYWMTYGMVAVGLVTAVLSVMAPSSGSVELYALSLFVAGLSFSHGMFSYMYALEALPQELFANATAVINVGYSASLGVAALCCGTIMKNWDWHVLLLVWWLPFMVIAVIGAFNVEESLPFLVGKRQWKKARIVAQRIAECNGTPLPAALGWPEDDVSATDNPGVIEPADGWGAVLASVMPFAGQIALCCVTWTTTVCGYYGLSYSAGGLSDNIYTDFVVFAIADIIGNMAPAFIIPYTGSRSLQLCAFLSAGFLLQICGKLPPGTQAIISCAIAARLCLDISFNTLFQLNVELFPATCRSTATGVTNFVARSLALFAPLLGKYPANIACSVFAVLCFAGATATWLLPLDKFAVAAPKGKKQQTGKVDKVDKVSTK